MPPVEDREAGRPAAILIAGPTASGKSALAIRLAQAFDGVIVNTDSMQVYRDLRVLTARPNSDEERRAPHRLYGTVDGAENFSVGQFTREVSALLVGLDGCLSIFVGGTGLYFRAIDEGISDLPTVPGAVRESVRARSEGRTAPTLHAELAALDPASAAALRPSDRMRVMRALEIFEATGQPIGAFQGRRVPGPLAGKTLLKVFLTVDREALRARIDARFVAMMEAGALEEVAALRERRLDPMLPVMRAHGVPGLVAHLDGTLARDEAIRRGQGDTRRYAKRQLTWFRHQMGTEWIWTDPETAFGLASARLSAAAAR